MTTGHLAPGHRPTTRLLLVPLLFPVSALLMQSDVAVQPDALAVVRTWVDAPLPNTVLSPPDSCLLLAHGTAPAGIATFEITIDDGAPVAVPSPDTDAALVTLSRTCDEVTEPGRHVIGVRAIDTEGQRGNEASTSFVIPGRSGPAESAIEFATSTVPRPETTLSPTTSPTTTMTPRTTIPRSTTSTTTAPVATSPTTTAAPSRETTTTVAVDTRAPAVSITHEPSGASLPEGTATTFTARAGDNVGIATIEILVRGQLGRATVVQTCAGVGICRHVSSFPSGTIYYSARATDTSGNQLGTPETTIRYHAVVR